MGTLYVVATPIGNLGDMSSRAIETLKEVDFILAEDTRQTIKLLNHFNIKNKMVSYHKYNEAKTSDSLIEKLQDGANVALVSDAGTPCISDPGYVLVNKARENNIDVIGLPGCSAVIDALSISGLDTSSFSFYGFLPLEKKSRKELFNDIKSSNISVKVIYESPKRIFKLLDEIKNEMPGCKVCVLTELTKMHEKCFYGKIDEVIEKLGKDDSANKGEYVVLLSNEVKKEETHNNISLEALIVDEMIKNNCSVKEAILLVKNNNHEISKKMIYDASLNLKELLKK